MTQWKNKSENKTKKIIDASDFEMTTKYYLTEKQISQRIMFKTGETTNLFYV